MRTRAAVLSVVPAVVLGLVVAPSAGAGTRPAPPLPGARTLTSSAAEAPRPALAAAAVSQLGGGTTRLIVKTRTAAEARSLHTSAARVGTVSTTLARLGFATVTVSKNDAKAARATLAALPGVESVREALVRTPHFTPNDPAWTASTNPQSTMYSAVQAPAAWDSTARGAGTKIAVLDGGFDAAHPDLAGKVVDTYDAVYGGSAVSDAVDDPYSGHGTATASTAAAATSNSKGIAGAAPAASLMLVQVGDDAQQGDIFEDTSASGIIWATDNGADVISMSYGSQGSSTIENQAVAYALSHGVVVVASAGNDGTTVPEYPAATTGVISVGATTHTGTDATDWSTRGSWVDVAAPGEGVRVAASVGSVIDKIDGSSDGYATVDGTSFSAPMVAGFAALIVAEHPSATYGQITTALTTGTKSLPSLAFSHGLVQLTPALASFTDDTVLTAPSIGEYSGTVTVTATSSSASVVFSVDGTTTSVTAPVTAGTATAELPLHGLVGSKTIRAVGCPSCTPGAGPTTVTVTVTSAAPVLTAPADASLAELTIDAAATADGGSVKFLVDGVGKALATTAPYTASIDTSSITSGDHVVSAIGCNADGTTCETAQSNAVTVTVRRLRPTATVSPTLFSPNGDGRKDTATITYTLEQTQAATLRVFDGLGNLVRGPLTLGTKSAGTYSYVWNGKNTAGSYVADGTYRLELSTAATISGIPWIGRASATVRSDRTKPGLSSTSASPSTFYPYPDGYRDTSSLRSRTNEAVTAVTITIYNSSGTKVRTLTGTSRPVGWLALTWNGKSSSGKLVAAGTYKFTVMAQDAAGNRATTGKYSVVVSSKKLTKKTGTKVITAYGSNKFYYAAPCSDVFKNVRAGWPDTSLGYFSGVYRSSGCPDDGEGNIALGWHAWTLPSAIKYGSISVAAYGASYPGYSDQAQMTYVLKDGQSAGAKRLLYGAAATYKGSTVSASSYLNNGRTMQWVVATAWDNWYEVRNFTVTWTYYVLA